MKTLVGGGGVESRYGVEGLGGVGGSGAVRIISEKERAFALMICLAN